MSASILPFPAVERATALPRPVVVVDSTALMLAALQNLFQAARAGDGAAAMAIQIVRYHHVDREVRRMARMLMLDLKPSAQAAQTVEAPSDCEPEPAA